ncbi:Methyltransferase type 12 [Pseudodesulfovibrio mercurii]|uniref:Methyltransferase type 12 n=1 Tax=Pseudodesulfovibrio mercurii TaxID=641491 RepID=F0JC73_9BACT|nr:methyltransferase domain-containing protein [Pseudodesulfovibrio mercurii]EGB15646.1 Methyltransferase type 12 [Pseudodesulfovibrio mercurii]
MTGSTTACPVCGSDRFETLFPDYQGRCVTSQMFFIDGLGLENRCCTDCGFLYNAAGTRGLGAAVYNTEVWKPKPQIMNYSKGVKTSHQKAWETFLSLADLPESGAVLDVGGGTGAFLECVHRDRPGWELHAIEPGGGFAELCGRVPLASAHNAAYDTLDLDRTFDCVVSLSVLEHLENPLHALRWMHARLRPGGLLLLQLPDFDKLPGDLVCADHINKMTVPYTRMLARYAGFEETGADTGMVMFYLVLRKGEPAGGPVPSRFADNLAIARRAESVARATIEAVRAAVDAAESRGGRAAVFGTSPIGSMAHLLLGCRDRVACFVDENKNAWGRDIDGLPVVGPERMAELGVTDLALGISPVYWETVAGKMRPLGVTVHVPQPDQPEA